MWQDVSRDAMRSLLQEKSVRASLERYGMSLQLRDAGRVCVLKLRVPRLEQGQR